MFFVWHRAKQTGLPAKFCSRSVWFGGSREKTEVSVAAFRGVRANAFLQVFLHRTNQILPALLFVAMFSPRQEKICPRSVGRSLDSELQLFVKFLFCVVWHRTKRTYCQVASCVQFARFRAKSAVSLRGRGRSRECFLNCWAPSPIKYYLVGSPDLCASSWHPERAVQFPFVHSRSGECFCTWKNIHTPASLHVF